MKNLLSLILAITLILSLAACGATPAPAAPETSSPAPAAPEEPPSSPALEKEKTETTVRVAALKGPTAMGMVKLMEEAEAGETANKY